MSNNEISQDLQKELDIFFPRQIKVEFKDLFADNDKDCRQAIAVITRQNLPLPLITINDVPVIAGGIDLDMIVKSIKAIQV